MRWRVKAMKLNLNHDADVFRDAFLISEERDEELKDIIAEAMTRAVLGAPTAEALEWAFKHAKNDNELVYMAFQFGYLHSYALRGPVVSLLPI